MEKSSVDLIQILGHPIIGNGVDIALRKFTEYFFQESIDTIVVAIKSLFINHSLTAKGRNGDLPIILL